MQQRFIWVLILIIYTALLINVMVFKNLPTIRVGHLMFNFGGADANGRANFVPLRTIVPYLLGEKGRVIAMFELLGNIALLVPVGVLVPVVYRSIAWQKALVLAVAVGLLIEGLQVLFH